MNTNTAIIEDTTTVQLPGRTESINNNPFDFPEIVPWPELVDAVALLDELAVTIKRFVVMPPYAAESHGNLKPTK
jgi:hypothetical protein